MSPRDVIHRKNKICKCMQQMIQPYLKLPDADFFIQSTTYFNDSRNKNQQTKYVK